MEDW
jgi:hypothetical protein